MPEEEIIAEELVFNPNTLAGDGVHSFIDGFTVPAAALNRLTPTIIAVTNTAVNVKNPLYGAMGNGVADDTAAINAASAAAALTGQAVYFPGGTYKVSSTVVPASSQHWFGDSRNLSILQSNSPTGTIVSLSNPGVHLTNLGFSSSVVRTGGYFITISASDAKLKTLNLNTPFGGIQLNAGSISIDFDDVEVFNNIGDGINIASCLNTLFRAVNIITGVCTTVGIRVLNAGDLTMMACALIGCPVNLQISPGAGQSVTSLKAAECFFDHATQQNVVIAPTANGAVYRCNFDGCWAASAPSNAWAIVTLPGTVVDGIAYNDCEGYGATAGAGLSLTQTGGTLQNVSFCGGKLAANLYGVFISNASSIIIDGNFIGPVAGWSMNTTAAIGVGGTSANVDIHDNLLIPLNGSPFIAFTATGVNNRIHDNPGYNPLGAVAIAVGASPFTFTNGTAPSTVYGFGNGVTGVNKVTGQTTIQIIGTISNWSVNLGPNEQITVVYPGAAPTMVNDVH
jgi:hypothetical protein